VQGGAGTRRPKLFLPETCLPRMGWTKSNPFPKKKKKIQADWIGSVLRVGQVFSHPYEWVMPKRVVELLACWKAMFLILFGM
jgi:hypothetical protein